MGTSVPQLVQAYENIEELAECWCNAAKFLSSNVSCKGVLSLSITIPIFTPMPTPIVTGDFIIQKMNMKGGWSYVLLPKQAGNTTNPFGWYIVKGSIDNYTIAQYKLWPTKTGEWFLPIKTEIKKKIHKQVGDTINIVLYTDDSEVQIPEDFLVCLEDYPLAKTFFNNLSATSQKQYIDHIYSSNNVMVQASRMSNAFKKMEQGKKWHQK